MQLTFVLRKAMWLLGVLALIAIGIIIVFGPKWPTGPIHIHLSSGHGITTQDFVGFFPIAVAVTWFLAGIWPYRDRFRDYIRESPEKAAVVTLFVGLSVGGVLGTGVGIIYRGHFMTLIRMLSGGLDSFF